MKRLVLLLLFIGCCSTWTPLYADENKQEGDIYRDLETFANVLTLIQQHYVEEIDSNKVITGAINGMLSSLDPHSAYMTPEDFKDLEEETSGSFTGVGIEISIRDGVLTAVTPIEGTPADRQGIKPGDQIIRINGALTKTMTLMEAVRKLRGEKGTSVTITIHRQEWKEPRDFTLTREAIPLISVKYTELEPGFGYIRISNFQATTTRDLRNALRDLKKKHRILGILLDLRNNPGGLLDQAAKVTDLFLSKGVIVSIRGRDKEEQMVFEAHPEGSYTDFPMVIVVNGGSASGSEIVAGALQDHKRAVILGTTTFGKGSVQAILPLPEGAGLRLTTAKYYTPNGSSIQATGIKPDLVVPFLTARSDADSGPTASHTNKVIREKDLPGHLENEMANKKTLESSGEDKMPYEQEEQFQAIDNLQEMTKRLQEDNQLRTAFITLKSLSPSGRQKQKR
ncbi:MAG: S41 family peptidase [Desulfobulbus sp.]|nr:S41 family peptidase [Desulfobulbus sp.]